MVGFRTNDGIPQWLETLMREKFFNPCQLHSGARKNERNIFCLDCCTSFCPHCLPSHPPHRLLQIRRYVYQDVARVDDLGKLIDCDLVQSYTTNSAKVVFISERPQTRPFRASANICISCDRSLQEPYIFCCLSCKVKHLMKTEGALSKHLYQCDFLPLPIDIDGQLTPDTVLDSPILSPSELARRKRSGVVVCSEAGNRRKGIPCRAPLY